jgi:hypothetical protein
VADELGKQSGWSALRMHGGLFMSVQTPLADLIHSRMTELGLDRQALGLRLGYQNPLKAAGRVYALCHGNLKNRKSRTALDRLPEALEIPQEVVTRAVVATEQILSEMEIQAEEQRRRAAQAAEAEWRSRFTPHAVIQTERTVPSQITFCALTGGAERWLIIPFDVSRLPDSYIEQALEALPEKIHVGRDGKRFVRFFGEALGFVINYSPDQAVRCDIDGEPLEVLPKAYRAGEVRLSLGGRPVEPSAMARVLGAL